MTDEVKVIEDFGLMQFIEKLRAHTNPTCGADLLGGMELGVTVTQLHIAAMRVISSLAAAEARYESALDAMDKMNAELAAAEAEIAHAKKWAEESTTHAYDLVVERDALREQLTGLVERIRTSEVVVQWGDEIAARRGELMVADELDALLHPKGSTEEPK